MDIHTLIINGPNLNLLGVREPDIYGDAALEELNRELTGYAAKKRIKLTAFQSNHEGEIIDKVQGAFNNTDYIIINPGGFTHSSVAIRDALLAVSIPFIEIHISNIYSREPFRHISYLSDISMGQITGLGRDGYFLAIDYIYRINRHGKKGLHKQDQQG